MSDAIMKLGVGDLVSVHKQAGLRESCGNWQAKASKHKSWFCSCLAHVGCIGGLLYN